MLFWVKKRYYRTYQKVLKFAMRFMDWSEPTLLEEADTVLMLLAFIKKELKMF